MLNIDWSKVPEGYDWAAQDENGDVFAHSHEPEIDATGKCWASMYLSCTRLDIDLDNENWRDTKTQRPDK